MLLILLAMLILLLLLLLLFGRVVGRDLIVHGLFCRGRRRGSRWALAIGQFDAVLEQRLDEGCMSIRRVENVGGRGRSRVRGE